MMCVEIWKGGLKDQALSLIGQRLLNGLESNAHGG